VYVFNVFLMFRALESCNIFYSIASAIYITIFPSFNYFMIFCVPPQRRGPINCKNIRLELEYLLVWIRNCGAI